MTIVAGFKCADGIVLCADTQETFGNAKRRVPKLQVCYSSDADHAEDLLVAIAGAGDGPFIDKLIEVVWKKVQVATSFDEACEFAEQSIKDTHQEYGNIFQSGYLPEARLVYDIKIDGNTKLFSSSGPTVNEQKHFAIHGSGDELGSYICDLMCPAGTAHSLSQLVILAAYIVYEAKIHADGVGGDTHLAILKNAGGSSADFSAGDKWVDQHFRYLDGFLGPAFLASADLDTPDYLADAHLDDLVSMLKMGRLEMKDWREKALAFSAKLQDRMRKRDAPNRPPRPLSNSQKSEQVP